MDRFRVSSTVVRKAVEQLRTEGLVVGHPGKGVFVRATPEESAAEAATIADLAAKLDDLRAQLEAIPSKASNDKLTSMGKEIAELRRQVATLQTHLVELYSRVGQPYPHGLTAPEGTGERRIRRA